MTLYDDWLHKGNSHVFARNIPDLSTYAWNDRAKSIKVEAFFIRRTSASTVRGGSRFTIYGYGFTAAQGKVYVGGVLAKIYSWKDQAVVVTMPRKSSWSGKKLAVYVRTLDGAKTNALNVKYVN